MRLGQVEQLLDAGAKADAEPFAPAERDQRMRQLVALAERVGPGIHEADDPLQPVRRGDDQRDEAGREQNQQPREQAPIHAAEEQDAHRDKRDDGERSEVRLAQQQRTGEQHHQQHRQEALLQAVDIRGLAHSVVRRVDHREQLHQLGRLQVEHDQRQPAPRAVDLTADARYQHQHQQEHAQPEQPRRETLPYRRRDLEGERGGDQADADKRSLAHQEEVRTVAGEAPGFGDCDRRRKHHHDADRHQQQHGPDQALVIVGHHPPRAPRFVVDRAHAAPSAVPDGAAFPSAAAACTGPSALTAFRNTWARCT